jgi:hypothetical protein
MTSHEQVFKPIKISDLRPGQITVGIHEVETRRQMWQPKLTKDHAKFLGNHAVPIIRGPKPKVKKGEVEPERLRVIFGGHHLTRGLHDEGREVVFTFVEIDLGHLEVDEFWYYLDHKGLIHPFDENGERRHYNDLPKTVADLIDDPYRSLAWETRRRGGYAKDAFSFSEFLWADFFRRRIDRSLVRKNFDQAATEAYTLARGKDANHLPGWCGPVVD